MRKTFSSKKLSPRPKTNFVENLISSISSLYLALISLAIIYSYVSWTLIEHNKAISNLIALDKLLLLRELAVPTNVEQESARLIDLPSYFENADDEAYASRKDGVSVFTIKSLAERGFTNSPIPESYIRKNVPMRLSVGAICDPLVTALTKGYEFTIITFRVVGAVHRVQSENVRLVTFKRCAPGVPKEFNAIIFKLEGGQVAFATPRSLDDEFPGLPTGPIFEPYVFHDIAQLKEHLPKAIAKYANLEGDFVVNHIRAIDYFILNYANSRLGKFFAAGELGIAAEKLYEEKEKDASYLGITATSSHIVRFGPLVSFVLIFELWRRVRRLPEEKILSDKFWFVLDGQDRAGRMYAYFSVFLPVAITLLMYVLFALSQNLALIVFDRVVSLGGLFSLDFPRAPPPGWRSFDGAAFLISSFLFPLQFLVLFLMTRKLIIVLKRNSLSRRHS